MCLVKHMNDVNKSLDWGNEQSSQMYDEDKCNQAVLILQLPYDKVLDGFLRFFYKYILRIGEQTCVLRAPIVLSEEGKGLDRVLPTIFYTNPTQTVQGGFVR